MAKVELTSTLRDNYDLLFNTCDIRPEKAERVEALVARITAGQSRYTAVALAVSDSLPWHVVGLIHCMEAGFDFTRHLHNGDSLGRRTVHVPSARHFRESRWSRRPADL